MSYLTERIRRWLIENADILPPDELKRCQYLLDQEELKHRWQERPVDPRMIDQFLEGKGQLKVNGNGDNEERVDIFYFLSLSEKKALAWYLHVGNGNCKGISIKRLGEIFNRHRSTIFRWLKEKKPRQDDGAEGKDEDATT